MAKKKIYQPSSTNPLDYPSAMSQFEKESLAAEARLAVGKKRKKKHGSRVGRKA
jgi:hypothetical protein